MPEKPPKLHQMPDQEILAEGRERKEIVNIILRGARYF